jgi:hypothetical protein
LVLIVIHAGWPVGIVTFAIRPKKRRAEAARRQEVKNFGTELNTSS